MVRSVPESEWDAEQVAWMQALEQYEADLCGGCGGLRSVTTDPKYDFYEPFNEVVFDAVPGTPVVCHQCAAVDRVQNATAAGNPKHPSAMLHAVHLAPRATKTTPGGLS